MNKNNLIMLTYLLELEPYRLRFNEDKQLDMASIFTIEQAGFSSNSIIHRALLGERYELAYCGGYMELKWWKYKK